MLIKVGSPYKLISSKLYLVGCYLILLGVAFIIAEVTFMAVYKITNTVNQKIYIGQTCKSLEERWKSHLDSVKSNLSTHLYNAMRKYRVENFQITPIAEAYDQETLDLLEDFFIQHYDSIKSGYNMMGGGRNNLMDYEKSKNAHDEKMRTAEVRNKISRTLHQYYTNNHDSDVEVEHRRKLSEQKKALYASPEGDKVKEKFRNSFKFSPEHYCAINSAKYKPVYCVDLSGAVVKSFICVKDAAIWWYEISDKMSQQKNFYSLYDFIKKSSKENCFIDGLKWIYGEATDIACGEAIQS